MSKFELTELKNKTVTAPEGFYAAGMHSGIKKSKDVKDLALVYSEIPASAAGVFTTNAFKAAPVLISMESLEKTQGMAQAIIANSGCANCCTGADGDANARSIACITADMLNIPQQFVLCASTGSIGTQLPVEDIFDAIPTLADEVSVKGGKDAAEAILTTDLCTKYTAVSYEQGKHTVKIGSICKGSGMICPNMATMLCFITTDAAITPELLHKALSSAVSTSFNKINVDGDMSTNDTVFALANGMSEAPVIDSEDSVAFKNFTKALTEVCDRLSYMIIADGEGATKTVEITVKGAPCADIADTAVFRISNSALYKCSVFGAKPGWGRIMAALGGVSEEFETDKVTINIAGFDVFKKGEPRAVDEKELKAALKKKHIKVCVDLGLGNFQDKMLTCDYSHGYIDINK